MPEGNTSCVRRVRSNTPLQALITLNETIAVEAARALARKALAEGGRDRRRSDHLRLPPLRRPGPDRPRACILLKLLDDQTQRFADGWASPWEIVTGSKAERPTTSRRAPARPSGPPIPWSPGCC